MTYASATKTYTTTGAGLTSGIPGIEAKDPKNAKITFDGKSYEVAASFSVMFSFPSSG